MADEPMTYEESVEIAKAFHATLDMSGHGFWVHARERDGLSTERLTVTHGHEENQRWFTVLIEFHDLEGR